MQYFLPREFDAGITRFAVRVDAGNATIGKSLAAMTI
jgi:hypothetical protein